LKKFDKKLTIEEMKKKAAEKETSSNASELADKFAHMIDAETDKAVVEVIRELGFEAEEGMSLEEADKLHGKMKEAGQYINISTDNVGSKYVVTVSVIQTARTLEFDLGGDE
jgi:hypothetical protein